MTTSHSLRGVLYFVTGLLLFACLDTTIKHLSTDYNIPLLVAVRYIVNLGLMVVLLGPTYGRQLVRTTRTGLVLIRALCLVATSLLIGLALQRLPVAETTAINFLAPLIVVILSGRILGERIGCHGWVAAMMGLAGVVLICRPGSGLELLGVACALAAVGAHAAYQLLSRVLAATELTIALLFHAVLAGALIFGLALPWFAYGREPSPLEILLFLSLGVYGGLGHFLFTAAYRHAPASLLAPMSYLQLLWAGLLGWLVFGHVPDAISLVGMSVIAVSGVLATYRLGRSAAET